MDEIEALWTVEFVSNAGGYGGGAVVFETNRLFGGDSQYYYLGTYNISNGRVNAELDVIHFAGEPESIFDSAKHFSLNVEGELGNPMDLTGHVVGSPNLTISLNFTRRADLPNP